MIKCVNKKGLINIDYTYIIRVVERLDEGQEVAFRSFVELFDKVFLFEHLNVQNTYSTLNKK